MKQTKSLARRLRERIEYRAEDMQRLTELRAAFIGAGGFAAQHAPVRVLKAFAQSVPDVREQLEMGFIPVPTLDRGSPSTSFRVRGQDLRVDLLTPLVGKQKDQPGAAS